MEGWLGEKVGGLVDVAGRQISCMEGVIVNQHCTFVQFSYKALHRARHSVVKFTICSAIYVPASLHSGIYAHRQ